MAGFLDRAMSVASDAFELGASAVTSVTSTVTQALSGEPDDDKQTVRTTKTISTNKALIEGKETSEQPDSSSRAEEVPKFGRLEFKLDYNFDKGVLQVSIIQAVELPGMDTSGTSDPYCRVYILPDKKKTFETKKFKKTLNPVFNQTFSFSKLPFTEISNKTLVVAIYDHDSVGSDDQIGEVQIPLSSMDLAAENLQMWKLIKEPPKNVLGEICCSLRFVPKKNQLTCMVIECRNLKAMDVLTGASDPYVKINLMQNGRRVKKVKTSVKMKNINPYYNESFKFDVKACDIVKTELLVYVMDYDRVGSNDAIGWIRMGRTCSGTAGQQWREMIASNGRSIAQWHSLISPDHDNDKKK